MASLYKINTRFFVSLFCFVLVLFLQLSLLLLLLFFSIAQTSSNFAFSSISFQERDPLPVLLDKSNKGSKSAQAYHLLPKKIMDLLQSRRPGYGQNVSIVRKKLYSFNSQRLLNFIILFIEHIYIMGKSPGSLYTNVPYLVCLTHLKDRKR